MNKFLQSQQLTVDNKYHCPICSSLQSAELKHSIISAGNYLAVQIKRFTFQNDTSSKDITFINSSAPLSIPISNEDEVSVNKLFQLHTVRNHSGTLTNGHYWSVVSHDNKWVHCNDKAVVVCRPT